MILMPILQSRQRNGQLILMPFGFRDQNFTGLTTELMNAIGETNAGGGLALVTKPNLKVKREDASITAEMECAK